MRQLCVAVLSAVLLVVTRSVVEGQQPAQAPGFRSSVEVTQMDVSIVDDNGKPVAGLTPADFKIRIDGKDRKVVSAQWVALTTGSVSNAPAPVSPPPGYSSNQHATDGRLILVAIDQPNIRPDGALGLRAAVGAFIDHLEPSDRIAAVSLGHGVSTPFTADRQVVKDAISRMAGDQLPVADLTDLNIAAAEALDIVSGDEATLNNVMKRVCGFVGGNTSTCSSRIMTAAFNVATSVRSEAQLTLSSLHGLLDALKAIKAPKTIVLVSEGFAATGEQSSIAEIGRTAAAAQVTLYVLKLDEQAFDTSRRERSPNPAADRQMRYEGVEELASLAKGDVFNVLGTGSSAFARIEREVSGYYLVGVESLPSDTDGKEHKLGVEVLRKNVTVRARRELAGAGVAAVARPTALDGVREAMKSPLMMPGLSLSVATLSVRDPDPSKIQVWIHADVGRDYVAPTAVTLAYLVTDRKGTVVVNQTGDARLAPAAGTDPSPLVFTSGATLAPGDYTLKIVINEGGRVGSIEHPIHAALIDAGAVTVSDLFVGGPADAREVLRPSIGYDANFGGVQGYFEAYGVKDGAVARYEVARDADSGPALVETVVAGRSNGEGRSVFSTVMPVGSLPAGSYHVRATLLPAPPPGTPAATGSTGSQTPLKRMTRAFSIPRRAEGKVIAGLAPGGTPATATSVASRASSPAGAGAVPVARPFHREAATAPQTVERFRETLALAARKDFDEGVQSLTSGDYVKAEVSFKSAQRAAATSGSGAAPLAYLGATYAASGHDLEAANVWQNALIDGSDYPQIYEWLADTLVRVHRVEEARAILKEALEKWSTDLPFAERLAALPAAPAPPAGGR